NQITSTGQVAKSDEAQGYFRLQPDLRRCVSPLCGGEFVTALNQGDTRYVAELSAATPDLIAAAGLPEAIVKGSIVSQVYPHFGDLGKLIVSDVYLPQGDSTLSAAGTFYSVKQDFRRCVAPACGGLFVAALNQDETLCADGQLSDECYAGLISGGDALV